ncbi:MAG: hypothetical protein QXK47_02450 [Candidatus Bathyarchaeia archaeon]
MSEEEIDAHWEYTKKLLLKMLELCEILYKEAMKHGAKHEKERVKDD